MTNKHFDAILSKNELAKMIVENEGTGTLGEIRVSTSQLKFHLMEIERFIGTGNQPSVFEIINQK